MEGEIGHFRRRHLVPVPKVASLAELNDLLAAADEVDDGRVITGRPVTIGAASTAEAAQLMALPVEPFDPAMHLELGNTHAQSGAHNYGHAMPERLMFVQLKSGYNKDQGPAWIGRVRFSKSWQTAYFHGLTLRREQGVLGNFTDIETGDEWWLSGPKRDRTDARYSNQQPIVDEDARVAYETFLTGSHLPGREQG